jgi:hypothetical protein
VGRMGRDKDARAPRISHPDESVEHDVGRSYSQQIAKTVLRHPTNKSDGNRLVYGLSKMIDVGSFGGAYKARAAD